MTGPTHQPRPPLSSHQREIWFDPMPNPDAPLYNIGGHMQFDGAMDPTLLQKAAEFVVQRHDGLRTILASGREDAPMQTFPEHVRGAAPNFSILN